MPEANSSHNPIFNAIETKLAKIIHALTASMEPSAIQDQLSLLLSKNPQQSPFYGEFQSYLENTDPEINRLCVGAICLAIMSIPQEKDKEKTAITIFRKKLLDDKTPSGGRNLFDYPTEANNNYFMALCRLIKTFPPTAHFHCQFFDPQNARIDHDRLALFFDAIEHSKLQSVSLECEPDSYAKAIAPFIKKVLACPTLTSLSCRFSWHGHIKSFIAALPSSHLTHLKLRQGSVYSLSNHEFALLSEAFVKLPSLSKLTLSSTKANSLSPKKLTLLNNAIKNSEILSLNLTNNELFKPSAFQRLTTYGSALKELITNPNLVSLDLRNNDNLLENNILLPVICDALRDCKASKLKITWQDHAAPQDGLSEKSLRLQAALQDNFHILATKNAGHLYPKHIFEEIFQPVMDRNLKVRKFRAENTPQSLKEALALIGDNYSPNAMVLRNTLHDELIKASLEPGQAPPEKITDLYRHISELLVYGHQLKTKGIKKGNVIYQLGIDLYKKTDEFFMQHQFNIEKITDEEWSTFSNVMKNSCEEKRKILATYRPAMTIVWNILAVLSGVGALALGAHLLYTRFGPNHRALFFGQQEKPTSERLTEGVLQTIEKFRPRKPS